jgi:hypothetical protein
VAPLAHGRLLWNSGVVALSRRGAGAISILSAFAIVPDFRGKALVF